MILKILKIPILIIILFSATASFSQRLDVTEKYAGVKAGAVISTLNLNVEMELPAQQKTGISAGLAYRYFNEKTAGIQLELNYIEKGGDNFFEKEKLSNTTGVTGDSYYTLGLKYIEFPFLMSLRMGGENSKFRINFGPNISYLISENIKFRTNPLTTGYKEKVDYKLEAGLNVGIAYSQKIKNNVFDLEVRYMHGFSKLYKPNSINNSTTGQNQGVSVSLIYFLQLKNKEQNVKNK